MACGLRKRRSSADETTRRLMIGGRVVGARRRLWGDRGDRMSVIPPSAGVRPEPGEGVTPSVRADGPPAPPAEKVNGSPTAAGAPGIGATSIADFLTDGSLAGLCAELSTLTGVTVELRDAQGRLIIVDQFPPGTRGDGAGMATRRTWRVVDDGKGVPRGVDAIPLKLGSTPIGWIIVGDGTPRLAPDSRDRLEGALAFLARTASELCQHEVELRHRVKEIGALTRMTALLVRAAGPDRVLEVALESALDVLELDAGSIVLLKEDADGISSDTEADLILKASRNLSKDWLECPLPLSKDRVFDRQA